MEVEPTPEEELTAAIETRQEFRDLLKSPAWDRLVKICNQQAENRIADVLMQATGLDSLIKVEYEKGIRAGIVSVVQLPALIIESLDNDIETLSSQIEETENAA
jgi:hypothetical protein